MRVAQGFRVSGEARYERPDRSAACVLRRVTYRDGLSKVVDD